MGEYQHSLDAKRRLIIPAKFRDQLGTDVVLTRGLDGCLFGYPHAEWQKLSSKLQALPLTKRNARAFVRFLYSAASACTFDKQGRINIPSSLCSYAHLVKKCMVIGVANRFEIWNVDCWNKYNHDTAADFDEIAEELKIDF